MDSNHLEPLAEESEHDWLLLELVEICLSVRILIVDICAFQDRVGVAGRLEDWRLQAFELRSSERSPS
jgi:hypothetical protein